MSDSGLVNTHINILFKELLSFDNNDCAMIVPGGVKSKVNMVQLHVNSTQHQKSAGVQMRVTAVVMKLAPKRERHPHIVGNHKKYKKISKR